MKIWLPQCAGREMEDSTLLLELTQALFIYGILNHKNSSGHSKDTKVELEHLLGQIQICLAQALKIKRF